MQLWGQQIRSQPFSSIGGGGECSAWDLQQANGGQQQGGLLWVVLLPLSFAVVVVERAPDAMPRSDLRTTQQEARAPALKSPPRALHGAKIGNISSKCPLAFRRALCVI